MNNFDYYFGLFVMNFAWFIAVIGKKEMMLSAFIFYLILIFLLLFESCGEEK